MDNMYRYLTEKVDEAQIELNILSAIAGSNFPPASSLGSIRRRRSAEKDEPHNRTRRLDSAVAAVAAGTGLIL